MSYESAIRWAFENYQSISRGYAVREAASVLIELAEMVDWFEQEAGHIATYDVAHQDAQAIAAALLAVRAEVEAEPEEAPRG